MRAMHKIQDMKKNKRGVSLAELLFAIGLMAFVATAAIGGIVVVSRVRETIDMQAKANMIMIATVSYLRTDLNSCSNPSEMDCTNPNSYDISDNSDNKYYPVFYNLVPVDGRYLNYKIRNAAGDTADVSGTGAKVQYYNTSRGICVALKLTSIPSSQNGITAPLAKRKYILGQNVMDGTGMISLIGGNPDGDGSDYGVITYDDNNKIFKFWVFVVEEGWEYDSEKSMKDNVKDGVILAQYVEVCPDYLI